MTKFYVVRRVHQQNLRQGWLAYDAESVAICWVNTEVAAERFALIKTARVFRRYALNLLSQYRWRVSVREFGAVDKSPKPDLRMLNWKWTNTQLAKEYGVSESTVANWRTRAGKPPAPRGGKRAGAGRRPTK